MGALESMLADTDARMKKSIENLKRDFSRVRTGRATPALLDGITIDYYGSSTAIAQIATVSTPDARMLMIQPWEKNLLVAIEKAIQASGLGLNPKNDGNIIRLPIPPLSEERRKELAKSCKKIAEDGKIAVRNIRRDSNDQLKEDLRKKILTEDQEKKALEDIQKITDKHIKGVDDLLVQKEKDLMEI